VIGLAVVATAGMTGSHPTHELWTRTSGAGYLLVHQAVHLPVWQFTPQWAFVPFAAVVVSVLLLAGFVVADQSENDAANGFQTGKTIVVGYIPPAFVATGIMLATQGSITAVQMIAPTVLVGVVVPALCGGVGGTLAARYR
jgi:hypothetical protein